jgi:hypothetical protein
MENCARLCGAAWRGGGIRINFLKKNLEKKFERKKMKRKKKYFCK